MNEKFAKEIYSNKEAWGDLIFEEREIVLITSSKDFSLCLNSYWCKPFHPHCETSLKSELLKDSSAWCNSLAEAEENFINNTKKVLKKFSKEKWAVSTLFPDPSLLTRPAGSWTEWGNGYCIVWYLIFTKHYKQEQ